MCISKSLSCTVSDRAIAGGSAMRSSRSCADCSQRKVVLPRGCQARNESMQETSPPKTEEEKYKEAAKKVGEAFLETAPGKEIKKKAEELGDAFISTLPGKVITGSAVAGAVATLAVTHKELPIGIPKIPLDKIKPGL